MYVVNRGPFSGAYGEGMELSQPLDLGVRLGLYDLDAVLAAGTLADEYGLDYFDCSAAIGFAMECYERGFLTDDWTDGLRLEWGNQDTIPRLIKMIARREGIGDLLANPLAEIPALVGEGTEDFMIHTKGMTFAGRDPRSSKGWGLSYAVSEPRRLPYPGVPPRIYAGPQLGYLRATRPRPLPGSKKCGQRGGQARVGRLVREPPGLQELP